MDISLLLGADTKWPTSHRELVYIHLLYLGFRLSYLILLWGLCKIVNLFLRKKVFFNCKKPQIPRDRVACAQRYSFRDHERQCCCVGRLCGWYDQRLAFVTVGKISTISIIAVAFLAYVIWHFNPTFKIPSVKSSHQVRKLRKVFAEEWPDEEADVKCVPASETVWKCCHGW